MTHSISMLCFWHLFLRIINIGLERWGYVPMGAAVEYQEKEAATEIEIQTPQEAATHNKRPGRAFFAVKRSLDIILSLIAGIILIVPMLLMIILIKIDSRGPAIFKQERIGKKGSVFYIYKLRTMRKDTPAYQPTGKFRESEEYLTAVGRILRRFSLDALPQLWNVIKGDMSIIGPRPLIPNEGEIHEIRLRNGVYDVRPGITGLAQISGRDLICDNTKAQLDIRYVSDLSFQNEIKIFFGTIGSVIKGVGYHDGK